MNNPIIGRYYSTLSNAIDFMERRRPKRLEVLEVENGYVVVTEEIYKKVIKQ